MSISRFNQLGPDNDWSEVSKEAFYADIGGQNVHPRIVGSSWPYTSVFETPNREIRGRIVPLLTQSGLTDSRYYLASEQATQ